MSASGAALESGLKPEIHAHPTPIEKQYELPTHERLGGEPPKDVDATAVTQAIVDKLNGVKSGADFSALFLEDGWWKDRLTFTWTIRTFHGQQKITQVYDDLSKRTSPSNYKIDDSVAPPLVVPAAPGFSYVQSMLKFDTPFATSDAVMTLVYKDGAWKIWTLLTAIDELRSNPSISAREERKIPIKHFEKEEPPVVIIGGGHSGLGLAAHLENINVPYVLLEKHQRLGDQWRARYDVLHLHSPSPGDALPFMPFPKHWPLFPGRSKVGDFMEAYANIMHLNVWTSSSVDSAVYDKSKQEWTLGVTSSGQKRTLKPKYVVLCAGATGDIPYVPPKVKGQDEFAGEIFHSKKYVNADKYKGKRVLVVGTASTGFDIAGDLGRSGVDTTMLQRTPTYIMNQANGSNLMGVGLFNEKTPVEYGDKLMHAFPTDIMKIMNKGEVRRVAGLDKAMLDGLTKAGFQWNYGAEDCGHLVLGLSVKTGGYFFDTGKPDGPCQLIVDGIVKVEQGEIVEFKKDAVVFSSGRSIPVDVVVMCTGYYKIMQQVEGLFGKEVHDQIKQVWGLDSEGELVNMWKPTPHPGLFFGSAGFIQARYCSKFVARELAVRLDSSNKVDWAPYEK